MIRLLLVLALFVAVPVASAQEPEDAVPGCERGPGTDADYAYCGDPCEVDGDDGDYAYCSDDESGAGAPQAGRPASPPAAAVQPLAAQELPMTGAEPWLIAGAGAGFLLAGAGLRLRFSAARS